MEIRPEHGFPQRLGKHKTLPTVSTRPYGDDETSILNCKADISHATKSGHLHVLTTLELCHFLNAHSSHRVRGGLGIPEQAAARKAANSSLLQMGSEILVDSPDGLLEPVLNIAVERIHDIGHGFPIHRLVVGVVFGPHRRARLDLVQLDNEGHARAERLPGKLLQLLQPAAHDVIAPRIALQVLYGAVVA